MPQPTLADQAQAVTERDQAIEELHYGLSAL